MLFESLNGLQRASLSLSLSPVVFWSVCVRNGGWDTQEMRMSTSWNLTGNPYTAMFIIQSLSRRQMEGQ